MYGGEGGSPALVGLSGRTFEAWDAEVVHVCFLGYCKEMASNLAEQDGRADVVDHAGSVPEVVTPDLHESRADIVWFAAVCAYDAHFWVTGWNLSICLFLVVLFLVVHAQGPIRASPGPARRRRGRVAPES